jgi:hypothetical protein
MRRAGPVVPATCPSCGAPTTPGAAFCARCGRAFGSATPSTRPYGAPIPAAVPAAAPRSLYPPPDAPWPPPGRPYGWPPAASSGGPSVEEDGPALADTTWAGLVLFFAFSLAFVAPALIGTGIVPATNGNPMINISTSTLYAEGALGAIAALLTAVGFSLLHRGFAGLRDPEFRTPANLSIVAVVAVLLLLVVDLALIFTLTQLISCLNSASAMGNSTGGASLDCLTGSVWAGVIGVLVFGLLAFIGYIGSAVGVYRLGRRNGETSLQVGAVLMCIPYLNVIGALLLIFGARGARTRLTSPYSAMPPGSS